MHRKGKRVLSRWFLPLAVSLLYSQLVYADTYYVDAASGRDTDAGAESAPWKTISRANSGLGPGDIVFIRGGEYANDPIAPTRSGTSGARIEYRAYPGERPKITNVDTGIILNKRDYIIVDGITVDGQANGQKARDVANVDHFLFINDGNYNIVRNSTMRDAHGWAGIHISGGSHHNRLVQNVIDNVGTNDDGIEDHGDSLVIKCANNNLVQGNTFTRGGHNLFEIMGRSNVVINNIFDNRWDAAGGARIGDLNTNEKYDCAPARERGNTLFEGNVLRNASSSGDNPENTALKVQGNRNIVRRNFFINNIGNVFQSALREPEHYETRSNRIFNNTLFDNASLWEARSYGYRDYPAEDNEFKNNIIAGTRQSRAVYADWLSRADAIGNNPLNETRFVSNAFHGTNRVDFRIIGIGTESLQWFESEFPDLVKGNVQASPTFVSDNPKMPHDFELASGSAMIDAAADLTVARISGSGSVLPVEDAGYFFGRVGFGIYPGDDIIVGFSTSAQVVSVDYDRNELTLSGSISWSEGDPVNLLFDGNGPDLGALESGETNTVRRPQAPSLLTLTVIQ